jgi:hypothetical protein
MTVVGASIVVLMVSKLPQRLTLVKLPKIATHTER